MIVRDFSEIPFQAGNLPITDRIRAMLKHGMSWTADMKSQDTVARYLLRTLDNSYTLLRNVNLPDPDVTVPLILVGPPGLTVIYPSPARGIFRTQGNSWSLMNQRSGSFQASKPNLVMRTALVAQAVQTFLRENGFDDMALDGVLAFTNPGTHVDAVRPIVRIVLIDGLERFATQLAGSPPTVDQQRRFRLIEIISQQDEPELLKDDLESRTGTVITDTIDTGFDQAIKPIKRKANFSMRQWLLLGAMVMAEIIILVIFLFVILMTA